MNLNGAKPKPSGGGTDPPLGASFLRSIVPGFLIRCSTLLSLKLFADELLTDEKIIIRVVRKRLQIAKKRHDQYFRFFLNSGHRNPDKAQATRQEISEVCSLLPSRRSWLRPKQSVRSKLSNQRVAEISILNAVALARSNSSKEQWLISLNAFVRKARRRMKWPLFLRFQSPKIIFKEKDPKNKVFRAIATFNFEDQVIIGIAANHLREVIDPYLVDECFAFRTARPDKSPPPKHHDAVEALRNYVVKNSNSLIYVAECDIQKFFDTVNHEVAEKAFESFLVKAIADGREWDRRLPKIFRSYLRSYNYPEHVEAKAEQQLAENGIVGGSVKWARKELGSYYPNGVPINIGVPQGGALSPVIANMVLHSADCRVHEAAKEFNINNYFYARYCDDMILATTEEAATAKLFVAYIEELKLLKLPYHTPVPVQAFSKDFFECKTKDVYAFGAPRKGGVSPWLAFLGYHVRYDGRLRVRKSSLAKEIEKQILLYCDILNSVNQNGIPMRVTAAQALHRARMKLISMSVGRAHIHHHGPTVRHELCWVNGFELLKKYPHSKAQLKALDRVRARLLTKLRTKLNRAVPRVAKGINMNDLLRFYGRPFSYYAQFNKK